MTLTPLTRPLQKKAIVTGGMGLIGRAICHKLLGEGWAVASFDYREGDQQESFHQHPDFKPLVCDIANEADVEQAFKALGWDSLDLLVNNAGATDAFQTPLYQLSLQAWRRITDSHLTGAFLMSRSAVPLMTKGASLINIVSTRAFMSEPNAEAYAAAKGGLVALTHAMAISLGESVRVNGIAAGWISDQQDLRPQDHAQHPVGRVGRPQDIAEAILYLTQAGFMTGQILTLDGGMTRKMIYAE